MNNRAANNWLQNRFDVISTAFDELVTVEQTHQLADLTALFETLKTYPVDPYPVKRLMLVGRADFRDCSLNCVRPEGE